MTKRTKRRVFFIDRIDGSKEFGKYLYNILELQADGLGKVVHTVEGTDEITALTWIEKHGELEAA